MFFTFWFCTQPCCGDTQIVKRGSQLPVEGPGQVFGSVSVGKRRIFLLQERMFVSNGIGHRLFIVDVQLAPKRLNTTHHQLVLRAKGEEINVI